MQAKQELRLAIKERLGRLSVREREVESAVVCRELKRLLGPAPRQIGAYMPFLDEPDIRPLLTEWLASGWKVGIPFVHQDHSMGFWNIGGLADVIRDPVTRMFQPIRGVRIVQEMTIDTVIIPGRAFTASGDRIGRGNGGYDRWIREQRQRNPSTKFIGTCFDCQIMATVPLDAHDEPVDSVVTATRIFRKND